MRRPRHIQCCRYSLIALALLFHIAFGANASGDDSAAEPRLTLLSIGENVYTVGSVSPHEEHPVSGDAHFVVTGAGVVLIDTGGTPAFGRALLKLIRAVTDQKVTTVILTHWHWDHVSGAAAFAGPGVDIIAHENVAKNFKTLWPIAIMQSRLGIFGYQSDLPHAPAATPTKTYKESLRFRRGAYEFVLHATRGETDDQTFVHLPDQGVLFVGDHFNPMLGHPLSPEGTLDGFLQGLDLIERLAPTRIVHGHGEFGLMTPNLAALRPLRAVSLSIRDQVQALASDGVDLGDAQTRVALPKELESDPFARVLFKFIREPFVNRLHGQMTGYYGANATRYAPAPRLAMAKLWLGLAGGADAVLNAAESLIEQGEHQSALELLDVVLTARADDKRALGLEADAFEKLSARIGLSNFYRYYAYLAAARKARIHGVAADEQSSGANMEGGASTRR